MSRLLVTQGRIVTSWDGGEVLSGQMVAIEDGLIVAVGPESPFTDGEKPEVIDARGGLIAPGFINAHTHFYSAFACGLGKADPASNFKEVLHNLWWRLDRQLSLDDVAMSALVSCLQAIRSGTTTVFDHHASPGAIKGSLAAIAAAVRQAGLRASLCYEVSNRDGSRIALAGLEENAHFLGSLQAKNPQIQGLLGLHASFTLSDETLTEARALVDKLGVGVHIHVAEDLADQEETQHMFGARVVQRLQKFGLLGRRSVLAHCIHVDQDELKLLAETQTVVTHQPQSNMNNAVGVMDLRAFLDRGILVGLGTDAMTENMREELRTALWLQKLTQQEPSGFFMEVVSLLARNNPMIAERHFPVKLGKLAPGYAADLIVLDYQPATPLSRENLAGHLVFGISQVPVRTTIASGKVLMRDFEVLALDEAAILAQARDLAGKLWHRF